VENNRNRKASALIAFLFILTATLNANPSVNSIQSLILDLNETEFWIVAGNCGWNQNHIAISDTNVTSINYISEICVYSKDNKLLFYIPKVAMTRAVVKGYLQLAVYDRKSKKVDMKEKIQIYEIMEEILPETIVINMSLEQFRAEIKKIGWDEYLVPRNEKQVSPVNWYKFTSVYTTDGYFLFDVARDQADYMVKTGYLSLAKMPNDTTIEIIGKIPLNK